MHAALRSTSPLRIWNIGNYIYSKEKISILAKKISLKIIWVNTERIVLQRIVCRIDRFNFIF